MTKTQLIKELTKRTGFSQKEIKKFFSAFEALFKEELIAQKKVSVPYLGKFELVLRKGGVSPKTKQKIGQFYTVRYRRR